MRRRMMTLAARRTANFFRQPLRPRWFWPAVHAGGIGFGLVFGLGLGFWLGQSGRVYDATVAVTERALHLSGEAGLAVTRVYADGRQRTDRGELGRQLGISIGQPILAVDTDEVQSRLEALPWVEHASVGRLLPDTIKVRLIERQPLALWQNHGTFSLIDRDGGVIVSGLDPVDIAKQYSFLRVLVGQQAPDHAVDLFRLLSVESDLSARVVAATWVGDRRWTLHFDNDVDVLLPESRPREAWQLFARKARKEALLERAVKVIDLRFLPDRIRLRLDKSAFGDETV